MQLGYQSIGNVQESVIRRHWAFTLEERGYQRLVGSLAAEKTCDLDVGIVVSCGR